MVKRTAVAFLVALALAAPIDARPVRHLLLGARDGFFVRGTQIVCGIGQPSRQRPRVLLCALGVPHTRRVLARSRVALLSDRALLVERSGSEPPQLGQRILFAQSLPATSSAPFPDAPGHRHSFVLERGDTVSIAATHIWCVDGGLTLTCSKVEATRLVPMTGAAGLSVSRSSIGVVQVMRRHYVVLASWPFIGGR